MFLSPADALSVVPSAAPGRQPGAALVRDATGDLVRWIAEVRAALAVESDPVTAFELGELIVFLDTCAREVAGAQSARRTTNPRSSSVSSAASNAA